MSDIDNAPVDPFVVQPTCGRCDKDWTINKQGTVRCQVCRLLIHKSCTDLDNDQFKLIFELDKKKKPYHWSCHSCGLAMERINASMLDVQVRLAAVEGTCTALTGKVNELDEKMNRVDEFNDKVENMVADIKKVKRVQDSQQAFHDSMSEMDERELKRDNLVIHNLPEPNAPTVSRKEGFEYDMGQIGAMCKEINIRFHNRDDVKFITRAGERQNGRPRPTIVGFRSSRFRDELLESAYKLKNTRLHEVRIVPDLTKCQRDKEQALLDECERKNASLSSEDAASFLYKVVGRKGQKRLIRAAIEQSHSQVNQSQISAQPYAAQVLPVQTLDTARPVQQQLNNQVYANTHMPQTSAFVPQPQPNSTNIVYSNPMPNATNLVYSNPTQIIPNNGQATSGQVAQQGQITYSQDQVQSYAAATSGTRQHGQRKRGLDTQEGSGYSPPQRVTRHGNNNYRRGRY